MKFKKITSLFCAGALMFGITAAPVGQASAYTVEVKESGDGVPVMPPEVAARYSEHRNHFYSLEDWANDETFFDYVLIMPGDTFEIPVYETSGGTIHFVGSMASDDSGNITNDPFFFIDVEGYDNWSTLPSDIYLPDGFEITGSVDPIPERTYSRAFHSSSGTFSVTFCEKWVNNTNCPIYLIGKGSGSGPLGDDNNQAHLLPQIMFYAPYYSITYPTTDENYSNNGLDQYFWPQGDLDDLEFPQYYWITDVPYHITFPNPVQARYHFDYWGSSEATQTNNGQYTDMTVCYSYGKDSHGNYYGSASFKGHGDVEVNPVFKSGTTITFEGNGGTINGRDEWIIEAPEYDGESGDYGYDLDDYAPVKNGDTFLGWCEKENTRYDSLVTKDDEASIYDKFWSTEYDRNSKNTNVVLYAKWASDTKEALEKNGWDIDDDGTLWLLNNNGVEAWNAARDADPTLAPKVKGIKQSYKKIDNNDFAYSLEGVFTGCVNLEDLVFEENVRWLSWSAFKDCTKLKTITFLDSIYNNLDNPMREAPKNVVVTVPETYTGRLVNFTYLTDDEERYGLTVNGELMTENHLTVQCGEGTATFDPATSTLTLENAELTKTLTPHWLSIYSNPETYTQYYDAAIVSDLPVLNVVLKGKNTVARGSLEAFRAYGNLNITGDGTIEAYYTLSNYFIIDSETGEQIPVTATFPMTITALGNVTLDGITAQRMNVQPAGNLVIKDSTLFGGVFTNNANLAITNSTLKQFTGGVSGSYDSGKDYTPTVGGKNMTIRNTTFDYVTVTAPEGCEKITFKDSTIQLSGKMTADENTKLTIDNTIFNAYGQSDGVTNISENNITLIDCEIKQGAWTQRGYFSIGELSPVVTYSISSDVKKWSNKTDSETPLKVTVNRSSSDNNNNYSSQTFRVLLDDNVVQKTNFTFKANGSQLDIMVNSSVVNELSVGSHVIKVVLSDGEASYSFNVYQPADQSTDTSSDKDKITDSDKNTDTKPKDSDKSTDTKPKDSDKSTDTKTTDSDKKTDTKTTDSDKKTDTKTTDSDKKTDTKTTDSDKKTDTKTTDSDKKTDTKTTDSDKKTDTSTDTTGNKTTDTSKTTDTNSDVKTDTSTDNGGDEGTDTTEPSDTNSDIKTDTSTDDGGNDGTDTTEPSDTNSDVKTDTSTDDSGNDGTDTSSDVSSDVPSDETPDTPIKPHDDPKSSDYDFKQDENKDWTPEQSSGLTLTVKNAEASDLTSITINGKTVDPSNYTVTETDEGIQITLNPDFLQTLSNGAYMMSANFTSGKAETQITVESEPEDLGMYGDIDGDGSITANDALKILRYSVGMEEFTPNQITAADIDGDELVFANDALSVLRASVGMADSDIIGKPITA